ncbi:glycosyltransferase family 2 protein [Deferribacter autotrophicus]|nr:glycosyltransferase family 2 protein [Deferribacter autotrophicus]
MECLNKNYSTTKLCYKLLDGSFLDMDGKIKAELKFKINNPKFKIQNSKLIGKPEDKFETMLFLPEGEERKGEGGLRTKGYFKHSYKKVVSDKRQEIGDKSDEWWIVDRDDNLVKKVEMPENLNLPSTTYHLPLISIITVVYNGEKYLEETIKSVINQTYHNVEYIIIDGGSTDGTLGIIKKYENYIDYWVSEPDEGIYDAMNKGILTARGKWIAFLNSDDKFINCYLLNNLFIYLFSDVDILYGNILKNGKIKKAYHNFLYFYMSIKHPATFINAKLARKIKFDKSYKIAGDYKLFLECKIKKCKFKKVNCVFTIMREGGVSSNSLDSIKEVWNVQSKMLKKYRIVFFINKILFIFRKVKFVFKGGKSANI